MEDYTYATQLAQLQDEIQQDYERQKTVARTGDPQRAGHGGEAMWEQVLSNWLPKTYEVGLRKYIIPEDGSKPFETDIVVFRPSCPPGLRNREAVLAGGVAAAFSVKTNLRREHLAEEVAKIARLKRSLNPRANTIEGEILPPFPYGIVAHTHNWSRNADNLDMDGADARRITADLEKADEEFVRHPREMTDLICVADSAAWANQRLTYLPPEIIGLVPDATEQERELGRVMTAYICTASILSTQPLTSQIGTAVATVPSPVGAFITALLIRLSYSDPSVVPIAESLRASGVIGSMSGPTRKWNVGEVYSEGLRQKLPYLTWPLLT